VVAELTGDSSGKQSNHGNQDSLRITTQSLPRPETQAGLHARHLLLMMFFWVWAPCGLAGRSWYNLLLLSNFNQNWDVSIQFSKTPRHQIL
jgi:hypothetical protein